MTEFERKFKRDKDEPFSPWLVYRHSNYLAICCSKYFSAWWNPEKFDWKYSEYLSQYCSNYVQWKLDGYEIGKVGIEIFSPVEVLKYLTNTV